LIIKNATIPTTTTTTTTTAKVGTRLGVGLVDVNIMGVVTELVEVLLVETLVELLVETIVDVDVVDVVTELIEVLLVETLVAIILTVPEPRLVT